MRSQGVYFERDLGVIVLCIMFLVSCIFFNKCLYFSSYMAGHFLDRLVCPSFCVMLGDMHVSYFKNDANTHSPGKIISAQCLHCQIAVFQFVINWCLVQKYVEAM